MMQNYEIKEEMILKQKVLYMRRVAHYGSENFLLMEKVKKRAQVNSRINGDTVIYGVALDNPQLVTPSKCRYDVCLIVPEADYFSLRLWELTAEDFTISFVEVVKNFSDFMASLWKVHPYYKT